MCHSGYMSQILTRRVEECFEIIGPINCQNFWREKYV